MKSTLLLFKQIKSEDLMLKEITVNGILIKYEFTYKQVKNVNLRIKPDGTVHVSANKRVAQKFIDAFIMSKADFILKALEKYNRSKTEQKQHFDDDEVCEVIVGLCKKAYPYYEKRDIKYPQIKFRKMVSRWGSCHITKGVLTFNTALKFAPIECIEYVVLHEFTHFLEANHSKSFYRELEKVCPEFRTYRKRLREINIR